MRRRASLVAYRANVIALVAVGAVERHPRRGPASLDDHLAHGRASAPARESGLDLAVRQAGLEQHLGGVLPQQGRRAADRARRVGQLRRDAERADRALDRVLDGRPPSRAPGCARRRTPARSRGSARTGRRPRPARRPTHPWTVPRGPLRARRPGRRRCPSVRRSSQSARRRQLVAADHGAQALEQRLRVAADRDVAVGGAQRLVGRGRRCAEPSWLARGRSPTARPTPTPTSPARPRTATCRWTGRGRCARARGARTGSPRRRTGRRRGRRPGRRT